jgi:Meiotically Up-regulated Gene 113 (MUG113) protein
MTKDHILAEIRRTAALNGGEALGKGRFLADTGIKESDWHGKYWVRWGDALREAGFEPNRLNAALSESHLLSSLADLVKELGHFPVSGEIKLKARSTPGFPSPNTYGRFGGKGVLAAKLQAWFLAQDDAAGAAMCAPAAVAAGVGGESVASPGPVVGFVYLLKSGKFYKIGKTNAVGRRERELTIQLPQKAETVHSIKTDDPAGIEEYWHRRFGDRRRNGEWFELAQADVIAFRRRRFM